MTLPHRFARSLACHGARRATEKGGSPRRRRALQRSLALVIVLLAAQPAPALPQGARGAYVPTATWEETATVLPPGVWNRPAGIDLTPTGHLYVVDTRLRRVEVLDADGNRLRTFGRDAAPNGLVAPTHVAVDEAGDRAYVCDPGGHRLAVYALDGTLVALWTHVGSPVGVDLAPDGRIVVAAAGTDDVRVLAPGGTETGRWGGTGTGPIELGRPSGVHVADDGTVWVGDRANGRVVGATLDGEPVLTVDLDVPRIEGAEPFDVAVDGDDLWVATGVSLARFDLANRARSVRGLLDEAPATAVTLSPVHGLFATVVPQGGVPGVWRYLYGQSSGEPVSRWGEAILAPGYFDGLEALTIGDDGHAWLVDVPPRVQRLDLSGTVVDQVELPDPVEADADPAGRLYAASGDTVQAFAADGSPRWEARMRARGAGVEVEVVGLAWDEVNQQVLALDGAAGRLHAFDPSGGDLVTEGALRSTEPNSGFWTDLAVGADGTRYALDGGNLQIRGWDVFDDLTLELNLSAATIRFDVATDGTLFTLAVDGWARRLAPDGATLAEWDATRLDLGRGSQPLDIAVDAAGRVYVVDGAANVVTVYDWDPDAPRTSRAQVESGCELEAVKSASPSEIRLGETTEVSLVVRGTCAGEGTPADIGLLIDTSAGRSQVKAARLAAEYFVGLVDPALDRVAIQPGGDSSGRLTNDVQFLRRVIRRLEDTDEYNLGGAITGAEQELFGVRGRRGVKKVMIVLSGSTRGDDAEYWEWYWIQRAAGQARRRGAEIYAIALGRTADVQLLYDIASSRAHVFHSRGNWQLDEVYARIAGDIKPRIYLPELAITDEIPANMDYVEGSSEPPASLEGRTLVWRLYDVPLAGAGVRYRLRPKEAGEWPTNVYARGDYVDQEGDAGRLDFPVPRVRVLAPTATPTASPTATATATRTPTRTATPTDEPTATPRPGRVYLPLLLRERCDPRFKNIDVAMVLDASTSMLEPTVSGRPKLEAAREAARAFLDRLDWSVDQAAVVSFHIDAFLLQPLTGDRAALDGALDAIEVAQGSNMALGVGWAVAELVSPRHRRLNGRVLIVLTDGRANPIPAEEAVRIADDAKRAGVRVFTVGLGSDLDADALRRMASEPAWFHTTPDADHLREIYEAIHDEMEIPCPAGLFWGRR